MNKKMSSAAVLFLGLTVQAQAQSFAGGLEVIGYEYLYAKSRELVFLPDTLAVFTAISEGKLVSLWGDPYLAIDDDVAFPFVQPVVKEFLDSLKFEYRKRCGEVITITSGTRPFYEQPRNAHALSIHPTGSVADVRVPPPSCIRWFKKTLNQFKQRGAISVIREYKPAGHFHIPVFDLADSKGVTATR